MLKKRYFLVLFLVSALLSAVFPVLVPILSFAWGILFFVVGLIVIFHNRGFDGEFIIFVTRHNGGFNNINKAFEHAKNKRSDAALIYMKNDTHTRQSVEDGIKYYEKFNTYRFSNIIIVTKNGRIHNHKHNK